MYICWALIHIKIGHESDTLLKHTPAETLLTPAHCGIKSNMELKWFELYSPTSELDVDILSYLFWHRSSSHTLNCNLPTQTIPKVKSGDLTPFWCVICIGGGDGWGARIIHNSFLLCWRTIIKISPLLFSSLLFSLDVKERQRDLFHVCTCAGGPRHPIRYLPFVSHYWQSWSELWWNIPNLM